jgi:hypothetical protein
MACCIYLYIRMMVEHFLCLYSGTLECKHLSNHSSTVSVTFVAQTGPNTGIGVGGTTIGVGDDMKTRGRGRANLGCRQDFTSDLGSAPTLAPQAIILVSH